LCGDNTRYMSHTNNIEHVQLKSLIYVLYKLLWEDLQATSSHIQQEVKTSEVQEKTREWSNLDFFNKLPFLVMS
jgi:hypothetical protein